jgi:hypothetical protein
LVIHHNLKKHFMAHVKNSPLLEGVSGTIAELVIKKYGNNTVITRKPDMSRVKRTALQQYYQKVFKEAVIYARAARRDPRKKAAFEKILKPGQDIYHAALSHYLRKAKMQDR